MKMSTTTAAGLSIPLAAHVVPGQKFDPVVATNAYLATLPADKRASSNAYFEGGYWISLWGPVIEIIVVLFLLRSGLSRAMRDRSEKWSKRKPLQTSIYWAQFSIVIALL